MNEDNRVSTGPREEFDEMLARLERFITAELPVNEALRMASRVRARSDAWMCRLARRQAAARPEEDTVEVVRQQTGVTKREAKQLVDVSQGLQNLPTVDRMLTSGDITFGHAKALWNAAGKVGPEAVEADRELLNHAGQEPTDVFSRRARDWADHDLARAGVGPLERQHRAREARMWVERSTGLGVLLAKFPADRYQHLRQVADALYLQELRKDKKTADGGDPSRIRSPGQRTADVVYQLLTNRHPHTGESLPRQEGRVNGIGRLKASTQLIVTAQLGVIDGTDPNGTCEIIGVGPVPRSYLSTLSPDTQVAGMLYDRAGRVLWLGRGRRLANAAQRLALAVKYGGCSMCTEPMHRCDIHHVKEWRQDQGRTDIGNLVPLCRQHHRWLETQRRSQPHKQLWQPQRK